MTEWSAARGGGALTHVTTGSVPVVRVAEEQVVMHPAAAPTRSGAASDASVCVPNQPSGPSEA
jgi:hypothetical protein